MLYYSSIKTVPVSECRLTVFLSVCLKEWPRLDLSILHLTSPIFRPVRRKNPPSLLLLIKTMVEARSFLFSSESVNEGHPDKLCDQVSDAILDACLKADPLSKVACETATKDNMVMVFGEISTAANLDYEKIVRDQVREIGFSSFVDDLSSVESKGLSCDTCEVLVRINKQSPDIAGGVHVGKDDMDVGAGDQGIMFGYASGKLD